MVESGIYDITGYTIDSYKLHLIIDYKGRPLFCFFHLNMGSSLRTAASTKISYRYIGARDTEVKFGDRDTLEIIRVRKNAQYIITLNRGIKTGDKQ